MDEITQWQRQITDESDWVAAASDSFFYLLPTAVERMRQSTLMGITKSARIRILFKVWTGVTLSMDLDAALFNRWRIELERAEEIDLGYRTKVLLVAYTDAEIPARTYIGLCTCVCVCVCMYVCM
jgi:hypothetical protein